jgi:hypothetical protein
MCPACASQPRQLVELERSLEQLAHVRGRPRLALALDELLDGALDQLRLVRSQRDRDDDRRRDAGLGRTQAATPVNSPRLEPRDLGVALGELVLLAAAERRTEEPSVDDALEHGAGIDVPDRAADERVGQLAVPELSGRLPESLRELRGAALVCSASSSVEQRGQIIKLDELAQPPPGAIAISE